MNICICTPDRNRHGLRDYTGAFREYAARFQKHYTSAVYTRQLRHYHEQREIILRFKQHIRQYIAETKLSKNRNSAVIALYEKKCLALQAKYDELIQCRDEINITAPIFAIDCSQTKPKRYQQLLSYVEQTNCNCLALFCHGTEKSTQLGLNINNYEDLYKVMSNHKHIQILLYCCYSANIARKIALECENNNKKFDIIGHTTAGHTAHNPYVLRCTNMDTGMIQFPAQKKAWQRWIELLKTDFCIEYPAYSNTEIHNIIDVLA